MAFTFQIHDDIRFERDEELLRKAEEYRSAMRYQKVLPTRIVELTEDTTALHQCGVKACAKDIKNLSGYGMTRDDVMILDFEEHIVGQFFIKADAIGSPMDAPLYVRFRFVETPAELCSDSSGYDGWLSKSWIQEEYIHLDELPSVIALPRRYSFRYVEIKVMDTSPKWKVVFHDAYAIASSAVDETALPKLEVADDLLQRIYDTSVKTLADCMQDVFEDGPKRDRRLWLGDLRLQALSNYATFDHVDLVKRCLYLFAAQPCTDGRISANVFVRPKIRPDDTFLFDYSLFFISVLYDYLMAHEDTELFHDVYPVAKRVMDVALHDVKQGKLELTEEYPVFIDWSNEFDKDTAGQAVMIYVLKQFIYLAEKHNDRELEYYKMMLESMETYALEELYDKERHLFVSGEKREINIASQVWMTLAGVLDAEGAHDLMSRSVKELFPVKGIATPYMYHHIVEALFIAGLDDEAIKLMKSYWGAMLELGADTFWEAFDPDMPDYSPYGDPIMSSYCHAWSCTPAYLIPRYVQKCKGR